MKSLADDSIIISGMISLLESLLNALKIMTSYSRKMNEKNSKKQNTKNPDVFNYFDTK